MPEMMSRDHARPRRWRSWSSRRRSRTPPATWWSSPACGPTAPSPRTRSCRGGRERGPRPPSSASRDWRKTSTVTKNAPSECAKAGSGTGSMTHAHRARTDDRRRRARPRLWRPPDRRHDPRHAPGRRHARLRRDARRRRPGPGVVPRRRHHLHLRRDLRLPAHLQRHHPGAGHARHRPPGREHPAGPSASSPPSTGSSATSCAWSTTRRRSSWRSARTAVDIPVSPAGRSPKPSAAAAATSSSSCTACARATSHGSWVNVDPRRHLRGSASRPRPTAPRSSSATTPACASPRTASTSTWLLRQLVEAWPTDVTRITLVGHSMGGLVVRAATNHATASGQTWQHLVRDVVCLGTPHTGAALEKVAHMGSRVLRFFPESRPFSAILECPLGRHPRPAARLHQRRTSGRARTSPARGASTASPPRRCRMPSTTSSSRRSARRSGTR